MKQTTIGVFEERTDAEQAITRVHDQFRIPTDDIAFLYRNTDGEVREVKTDALLERRVSSLGVNVALGLIAGAVLGALAGLATVAGFGPFGNAVVALGPLPDFFVSVGLSLSAATVLSSAVAGAAIGFVLGIVAELILGGERARVYSDSAEPKNIVVAVMAPERVDVISLFRRLGAFDTRVYRLSI